MSKVLIYTTPTCHYCGEVKAFLKSKNVSYDEFNVATDLEKRKEMVDKSGQLGVPVTMIDDKIIIGYDEAALKDALGI